MKLVFGFVLMRYHLEYFGCGQAFEYPPFIHEAMFLPLHNSGAKTGKEVEVISWWPSFVGRMKGNNIGLELSD